MRGAYLHFLLLSSGGPSYPVLFRSAFAFSFDETRAHGDWHVGSWRRMPDMHEERVGGALTVLNGRLYATGGLSESSSKFLDSIECWSGNLMDLRADCPREGVDQVLEQESGERVVKGADRPWKLCRMVMPSALHAHHAVSLPCIGTQAEFL